MKLWRPDRRSLEAGVAAVRADLDLETRDPKGATLQVGWASSPGRPMAPEWDPQNAFRAYVSQWLVRRCIEIVADRVSSFPFRVGEDPDKPGVYDKKAPLAQLLGPPPGTPNPELDAGALWSWSIINYLVTGRFAWEIERGKPRGDAQPGRTDSSGIVGLWPLVTGEVFPIPSDGGRSYFTGFEQRPGNGQRPVPFTREEVAYIWKPSPTNPREAESALAAASLNVNILYEIDGYSYGFMRNDATPATMIVHGRFNKPAERDAWRNQVLGNHRGSENAGKAMFVEGDVDENGKIQGAIEVLKLGASARDSELTAIYEQQLTAVCGALGVPLSRLDASGRTFDNAGQEDTNWHEDKLLPLSGALAAGVNRDLAARFDDGKVGWFDLSKVRALRPQMATGVLFANVQADLTLDERRNFAGVDPADDETRKLIEDEKAAAQKAAMDTFAAQAAAKVPADPTGANDGGKNAPNADTSANAKTGNPIPAARPATREEDELEERAAIEPRDWHGRWITAGSVTHDAENLPIGTVVSHTEPGFDHDPSFRLGKGTIVGHTKAGYKVQELPRSGHKEGDYLDTQAIGPKRIREIHAVGDGPGRVEALNGSAPAAPKREKLDATGPENAAARPTEHFDRTTYVTEPGDVVAEINGETVHRTTKRLYTHMSYVKLENGEVVYATFHGSPDLATKAARAHAALFNDRSKPRHAVSIHVVPTRPAKGKRHAGPGGHDHVPSGHHEKGSLGDALVTARDGAVRRLTSLLAAQLAELDERAVSSTRSRATGKRGQQLLRDGEVRADALYDPDFWATATRTAVQPVFYSVAAAAELALGLPAGEADLEGWASARASAFAEARVVNQIGNLELELSAVHETTDVPEAIAARAESLRGASVSSQVIADAWDDAVRSLTPGVAVGQLRELVVKLAAGELDLDAALAELGTT